MEPFYKSKGFRNTAVLLAVLLIGIFIGRVLYYPGGIKNPRLATVNGEAIFLNDVEIGMSESERSGNSMEYKKQLAANIVREKVLRDLAAKAGLSTGEYVKKIKDGADSAVSNEELEKFLKDGGFTRAKMSKAQIDNIRNNMQEQKREAYFKEFLAKEIRGAKVSWDNP